MNDDRSSKRHAGGWVSAWITAVLTASTAVTLGFWLPLARSAEDTEALESPLMLSVARQLVAGPWELYGPFGGQNPLVLIHAPLYYRLAALLAWSVARAGLDPVSAARVAGRSISFLGLLTTLGAAYRLARLDRAPVRAGWWAVLLIVAVPVLTGQPFAVRPDMLGVALQTTGVLLVLSSLKAESSSRTSLMAAYTAFGLAACVKQHFLVVAAISTVLLVGAGWRGRLALKRVGSGVVWATTIALVVYGLEELVTGGWMSQAVLIAAGRVGQVHPANWDHVGIVFVGVVKRAAGLIAWLAAAGLAAVAARPGLGRTAIAVAGGGAIGLVIALLVLHFVQASAELGALTVVTSLGIIVLIIPACAWIEPRTFLGGRLDAALWVYLAGELVFMTVLCRVSTGAWSNYTIQAVVFACVLASRALSRAVDAAPSARVLFPAVLAVLGVLFTAIIDAYDVTLVRLVDRTAAAQILHQMKRPRSEYFFADRPGLNRVSGRLELVYDDWLYPVFESLRLAEPRSVWLRRALTSGPVHVVVQTSDRPRVAGLEPTLYALGYHSTIRVGPFFVWAR
jgi:hypothetical protein